MHGHLNVKIYNGVLEKLLANATTTIFCENAELYECPRSG